MYPPFEYDMIRERREELWRMADQTRLAKKAARREHRRAEHRPAPIAAIGSALIRAGRALGGREPLRSPAHGS
ncbi:MAG TPA: hypothetical protein VM841_01900 [Actinomycetota bacterium]|nr:hypothetical protein [Actinomycetota bacterium]